MKIERTQTGRTNAAKPVRAPEQAAQAAQAYGVAGAEHADAPRPAGDVATIAGLTEADLTPKVRQALDLLMTELEQHLWRRGHGDVRPAWRQAEDELALVEV